jgi:hypothetical protein
MWVEGRLDCRTWSYTCDIRNAMAEVHQLLPIGRPCDLKVKQFQLVVIGPRYAGMVFRDDEPLGISREHLGSVPLIVLQNKMYVSHGEYTGDLQSKLRWASALGAAAAFTWIGSRAAANFSEQSGVTHHFLPFGVDERLYGAFAGNFSHQPFDIGFTGSSGPKYPLRQLITQALRAMPLRAYFGSWDKGNTAGGGNGSWHRLTRRGYVQQISLTKLWVSVSAVLVVDPLALPCSGVRGRSRQV